MRTTQEYTLTEHTVKRLCLFSRGGVRNLQASRGAAAETKPMGNQRRGKKRDSKTEKVEDQKIKTYTGEVLRIRVKTGDSEAT